MPCLFLALFKLKVVPFQTALKPRVRIYFLIWLIDKTAKVRFEMVAFLSPVRLRFSARHYRTWADLNLHLRLRSTFQRR